MRAAMDALRRLYHKAYHWNPPPYAASADGAGVQGRMRYKVRAAINEWDLHRLHSDYRPATEIEAFTPTYDENADLEREAGDGG